MLLALGWGGAFNPSDMANGKPIGAAQEVGWLNTLAYVWARSSTARAWVAERSRLDAQVLGALEQAVSQASTRERAQHRQHPDAAAGQLAGERAPWSRVLVEWQRTLRVPGCGDMEVPLPPIVTANGAAIAVLLPGTGGVSIPAACSSVAASKAKAWGATRSQQRWLPQPGTSEPHVLGDTRWFCALLQQLGWVVVVVSPCEWATLPSSGKAAASSRAAYLTALLEPLLRSPGSSGHAGSAY